jgi:nucleotide-binding universal stress UspA family protein
MTPIAAANLEKILVATDFSDTAESGVDWALRIATENGAKLWVVHGLLLPSPTTDFVAPSPAFFEELQHAALERLNQTGERAQLSGVEVEIDLRPGLPSQVIVEAATEHGVDLVVIGTRGLSGIRHLLLGSTAERVVQRSKCPVLTVHSGDIDKHRPIRRVLIPTDFSPSAELGLESALTLLGEQWQDAELCILNVYHLPFEYTAYGTIPTSVNYLRDVKGQADEELEKLESTLRSRGLKVTAVSTEGYPPDQIIKQAEEFEADLIAMGTHGRSGVAQLLLGSTAARVVQHASCPVLTAGPRQSS